MKVTINIVCNNKAFFRDTYPGAEVARMLRVAANKLSKDGLRDMTLEDCNGNIVGELEVFGVPEQTEKSSEK